MLCVDNLDLRSELTVIFITFMFGWNQQELMDFVQKAQRGVVLIQAFDFSRGALAAVGGGAYGTGDNTAIDIIMDEVQCDGTESDIRECQYAAVHDCDVNEAASVQCIPNDGK